eukprot:CAMPEP_0194298598 /NCGR_PEP_ID=MMETSP0169-20130528/60254_1 /TAXON_ID=218684 /ORGANISM="Corethron pennatum, Strain L29A3" /LENGTH=389 /DNA_ID=CAMNT_0039048603 /DNA_START=47 /DNA_END=1216 /DNA_ORIENTATION=+
MTAPTVGSTSTEVFESDPLPLGTSAAGPLSVEGNDDANTGDEDDDGCLDTSPLNPTIAFEMFAGKTFDVPLALLRPPPNPGKAVIASPATAGAETPMMRLTRLQREVSELEADLSEGGPSGDTEARGIIRRAGDLVGRLRQAGTDEVDGGDVAALLRRKVAAVAPGAADMKGAPAVSPTGGGVTYELYGGGATDSTGGAGRSADARISALEKLVGVQGVRALGAAGGAGLAERIAAGLAERIAKVERAVASIDSAQLDAAAVKARVVRADLEAAARARSKMSPVGDVADAKKVIALHSALVDVEDVLDQLPDISERLRQLSTLHTVAADFSSRLVAAEGAAADAARTIAEVEEAIAVVGKSCAENAMMVEKNVAGLEERMQALMKKHDM